MSAVNNAAWLTAKQDPVMVVDEAPYPSAAPDELVIKTKAVAINPADWRLQKDGMLLTQYPAILGCDAAGTVEQVGSDLANSFKSGDRVIGGCNMLLGYKYAAFQEYVVLKMPAVAKIPDDVQFSQAVVLPLGINTAASCLFPDTMLGLESPPSQAGNGKTLLVWGASSSLGMCGIQLAKAAGYEVFGIASMHNHDQLKTLGAAQCFDYRDDNLVAKVVAQLKGKEVVGAFDPISTQSTLHTLCEILDQAGGRKLIGSVAPDAEQNGKLDVTIKSNLIQTSFEKAVNTQLWQGFLEPALASRKFQYKPDPEVVGHGLGSVQQGVDLLAQGVSAKKLVVTL